MKSDLHVVSRTNEIIKFADDTTILVPENTDVGLDVEFRQISKSGFVNIMIFSKIFKYQKYRKYHDFIDTYRIFSIL